jgi:CHC2 zinc finger
VTDVCFLCERNPITWPGTGMCERCHQETADLEHQAERADMRRTRLSVLPMRTIPDLLLRVARPRVPSLRLDRNGIYTGDCPWCDEDAELSRSFYVYPTNLYHCFACGATGDAIQFLMSVERLRFMQAVEWLAKECDLRLEPPQ